MVGEGDLVVQFGVRGGDWPGGQLPWVRSPRRPLRVCDTAFAYRVKDDRVVERWAVNDHLAMLLQLGAIPGGLTSAS